ncbi:MAG: hypothetical protein GEV28_04150 [Actinophytocola sp.]|uniref:DUF6879 family protein n=1 Tax=Actinophytocola sp. TaxID=1872138 RepID=UPI00132297F1|nr:DUF6879 family protein [Actinophytocola sp.]MPZ79621.1 hypothetical protein [Actinophytocola sp.]
MTTTWNRVEPDQVDALLDAARGAMWRWECRGDYSTIDATLLSRWRDGLGRDPEDDRPWVEYVQGLRRRGVRFGRARLLTEPLTEYLRMQLDFTHMNVEAGADVRWVTPSDAADVGMPTYDYYLVDDNVVAVLDFDAAGRFVGARVSVAPEVVNRHVAWRDLIWPRAVPHQRYLLTYQK